MPGENADLVRRSADAWNERGIEGLLEFLDPDVEWNPPAESMEPGIYRGHDGVRDYLGRLGAVFDERHFEPLEVVELEDDVVLATMRLYGRSEKFGTEIDTTWTWLITARDGRAVRVDSFLQKEEAFEAYAARRP